MNLTALPRAAVRFAARTRTGWAASCLGLMLLPGLGTLAGARAQAPAPQLPPKSYWNKQAFDLPVDIDDRFRSGLREIHLYSKAHPSRPWVLMAKEGPGAKVFRVRPTQDGEYWFTVVTVDQRGNQTPRDLSHEGPGVIVVHDTQPPQVDVRGLQNTPDGQLVQCEIRDGNPDPAKTRFEYQTADKVWRGGGAVPNRPDAFLIPAQAPFTGTVRVTAVDRAGNKTVRELNVGTAAVGEGAGPRNLPRAVTSQAQGMPGQSPAANEAGPALPDSPEPKPQPKGDPQLKQAGDLTPGGSAVPATRKIVNSTHVALQYQVEHEGSSGVGQVEVWVTADQGQSWQKLGEDPDHSSPAEVDLPGEGVYGLSLVVSNGRGFGATPPAPGDAPESWIEVDLTKPFVELVSVRPCTDGEGGGMWISWTARDKNLAAEPVELYYAPDRDGPWTLIAKGIRNDGRHRWTAPAEMARAFVRVVVTDRAGNSSQCDTPQAVTLDDTSRPRARVVDIVPRSGPSSPGPAAPGN
jgi:hypothetical protein